MTKGLGLASVLPLLFPFTLHLLLPDFTRLPHSDADVAQYQPIFVADDDASEVDMPVGAETKVDEPVLSFPRKMELAKPLIMRYMLWLFLVYVFEYIINSVRGLRGAGALSRELMWFGDRASRRSSHSTCRPPGRGPRSFTIRATFTRSGR